MEPQPEVSPSNARGIMQQIREHIAEGKSAREVISLGFAPGSVYKVRRQLRPTDNAGDNPSSSEALEARDSTLEREVLVRLGKLESETAGLSSQVTELLKEGQDDNRMESSIDQLDRKIQGMASKVETIKRETSLKADEQQKRVELLEQRATRIEELVTRLIPLVHHLDVHHRQLIHGWPEDPSDKNLRLSNAGYYALLSHIRAFLSRATQRIDQRQLYGLPISFRDLANRPSPREKLARLGKHDYGPMP
jgi:hypothetical protein